MWVTGVGSGSPATEKTLGGKYYMRYDYYSESSDELIRERTEA
ncbi:hypothetical protein TIFTF001_001862 [Ficus carica]|uniref:Uncharacterized protein n=1 Tax=Ficus carica TaxID=3494 RepID=A0AA87Z3F5_FICCA|nr:hypothetical protein TIFTF001_001862 [Ficus carica]